MQADSPASRAGILLGDVIVGVDGEPTMEPADLLPVLDQDWVGREIVVRVVRAGELRKVRVTVGERSRAAQERG